MIQDLQRLVQTSRAFALAAMGTVFWTIAAHAAFPERPILVIVPNPPGSSSDILVRQIVPKLSENLHQTLIVENRTGGNEMIGAAAVAHAKPDGYTFLFGTSTNMAANVSLFTHLGYDPVKDFSAIGLISRNPQVLAVNISLPVNSLAELVAYIKARPGKLNYALNAGGGFLTSKMFVTAAGLDIQAVSYPGAPAGLLDLLNGSMTFDINPYSTFVGSIAAGKVKILAITSAARPSWLPDVPTMKESGYPDLEFTSWVGFYAPAHTPRETIAILNAALIASLNDPAIQKSYASLGTIITPMTPEETDKFTVSEIERYRQMIKDTGATVQ